MITKDRGFSFMEIVVILFILVILLYLSFSLYQEKMQVSHRADAKETLLSLAALEEHYRTTHTTYGTLEEIWKGKATTPLGYYSLSIAQVSETGFAITANALGNQESDAVDSTSCNSMTLTKNNETITKTPSVCWEK